MNFNHFRCLPTNWDRRKLRWYFNGRKDPPPLVDWWLGGHPVDECGNVGSVLLQVGLLLLQLLQQPTQRERLIYRLNLPIHLIPTNFFSLPQEHIPYLGKSYYPHHIQVFLSRFSFFPTNLHPPPAPPANLLIPPSLVPSYAVPESLSGGYNLYRYPKYGRLGKAFTGSILQWTKKPLRIAQSITDA